MSSDKQNFTNSDNSKTGRYWLTLNEISDVIVKPCVMTGSSSAVRPFHTSNSTQRQPASRTCRYISTEELPASWPAEAQKPCFHLHAAATSGLKGNIYQTSKLFFTDEL